MSNFSCSLTAKNTTYATNTTEDWAFNATEGFKGSGKDPLKGSGYDLTHVLAMPVALGNLLTLTGF